MNQNRHKSKADLVGGFARKAERHWRQFRPKLWAALKEQGILYDELFAAGEAADNYMEKAAKMPGYKPNQDYLPAEEVALRTWILLPDLDQETEGQETQVPQETTE